MGGDMGWRCVCGEGYCGRRYGWEMCMWRGVLWEEV